MFRSMLAAALVWFAFVLAPAAMAGETEDLGEIQTLSGLTTLFDGIDEAWGGIGAQKLTDTRIRTAWQDAAKAALVPATMRTEALSVLAGALTEGERADLLMFYRSEFGRKVSALEIAAQSGDHSAEGQKILEGMTDARKALLAELNTATQGEINNQMFIEAIRSMMLAEVLAAAKGSKPVNLDDANAAIDARIKQVTPALLEELNASALRFSAYTYRDLSDDDLRDYLRFLRTAPAEKFYKLVTYGISMATDHALTALGTGFASRLQDIGA